MNHFHNPLKLLKGPRNTCNSFCKLFTRSDLSNVTFPQSVIIECAHQMKAKCLPFDKSNFFPLIAKTFMGTLSSKFFGSHNWKALLAHLFV